MNPARSVALALGTAGLLVLTGCGSTDGADGAAGSTTPTSTSAAAGTGPSATASASEDPSASAPAGSASAPAGSGGGAAAGCTPGELPTLSPGTLTIATSEPAYEPWIVDNDPTNGQGYESAVAYAVAEQLGYDKAQVTWTRVPFEAVIAPTPKDFDFDLNQVSISDERRAAVDFSSGYYDVVQAVVTVKGSPIEGVTTLAGLKDARLGAMIGTTSLDAISASIAPSSEPAIFDSNDAGVQALQAGSIDGLVLDLPSALYVANAQLPDGSLVGQLPASTADTEQFGLVLDKGSELTACVTAAVDALREDGTLDALAQQWIADTGAPALS
ncbi:ABC transporter substrate-binding protein [Nakamurella deserti]|uniref:ABC transporter substrate-binding protein n=1 Tax=Nakamurella deserti TaxID=2164074 RepID=UPI000DBE5126|nr:ABC transporter substrate-binding protein [Nakamurella deserti]